MQQNEYPPGWDEERVQKVIDYYENQTEDEAVAEAEEAFRHEFATNVEGPSQLVLPVNKSPTKHAVNDQKQQTGTKNENLLLSGDSSILSDFKKHVSWSGKPENSSAFYGVVNIMKQNLEMLNYSHD